MKTKVLKFVRKNLYQYDGIWLVKSGTMRPLYAMLLCQTLNNRKFYRTQFNSSKNEFKNMFN